MAHDLAGALHWRNTVDSTETPRLEDTWGTPAEGRPTWTDLRRTRLEKLVRRSILILPVNVPKFVEKAYARGADAVELDLEDSVPAAEKANARAVVRDAVACAAKGGADVLVRINKPSALAAQDLAAAVWPGLTGIHFPKAESARELRTIDRMIGELEAARGMPAGSVQLSVAVETALGLHNALEIALASPRITDIALGPEDYLLDIRHRSHIHAHSLHHTLCFTRIHSSHFGNRSCSALL